MKNKNGGIFIFENPEDFLKVMDELQEYYLKKHSGKTGGESNEY